MHRTGRVHHDYVQIFCNNIKELQHLIYVCLCILGGIINYFHIQF